MFKKYRIVLTTNKEGNKCYYAQKGWFFFRFWNYLDINGNSSSIEWNYTFTIIAQAEAAIENAKIHDIEKRNKKIVKVEYLQR